MSDHRDALKLKKARERADLARLRFANSLDSARRRLSPARLKDDAMVAVSDKVAETKQEIGQAVRRHPVIIGSAAVGALAFLFWKPARTVAMLGLHVAELAWFNRNLWRSRS